jgi:hypothetical protein
LGLPTKRFVVLAKAMEFFVDMAELFVTNACELHNFIIKKSNGVRFFYQKEQQIQELRMPVM